MTDPGYFADISSDSGDSPGGFHALVPVPFVNDPSTGVGVVSSTTVNAAGFGPTNFRHGMHSFRSGAELQYYLDRIAGPGANANITDAMHFRIVPSGTNSTASPGSNHLPAGSNRSIQHGILNQILASNNSLEQPVLLRGFEGRGGAGGDLPVNQPVNRSLAFNADTRNPRTKSIALFCELHSPQSGPATGESPRTILPLPDSTHSPHSHSHWPTPYSSRPTIGLGFCDICQSWMLESGGRSISFPPPRP